MGTPLFMGRLPISPINTSFGGSELYNLKFFHPRFWLTWILIGLLRILSCLPYPSQLLIGKKLGRLNQALTRSSQSVIDINLQKCFPQKTNQERKTIKNECYENIGITLMELGMCWWWSEKRLKPLVDVKGMEHLEAVLSSGKAAILLSGHFTSLEIGVRLFSTISPIQVMYRTQKNALFDSYLYRKRNSYLVNVISSTNTRKLIKGIKNLIPTWYAPDQNFPNERTIFAPFMGIPTASITASSRLAKSTNCAMLPFYTYRKPDGTGYLLTIEPPLENFPSGDDLTDATTINASIEKFVRHHPEQYMWVYKRFRARPEGEPSMYL